MNIKQIAQKAGVSYQTVSNVLNNKGRMSKSTREKVMRIIKQFDFYPSEAAKLLAAGRKDVIAFVSPRLASPFISEVLASIENRAVETGKYVSGIDHYSTQGIEKMAGELLKELLFGKKVSAVILLSILPEQEVVDKYKAKGVPLVLLETKVKGAHSVHVDNFRGAYDAVTYLLKKGRKKIAIVAGRQMISENEEIMPTALERIEDYKKALKDSGAGFEASLVEEAADYSFEEGKSALDRILSRNTGVDAVFCPAGDITAMGIMNRAKELGIKVPEDISVIGYDDILTAGLIRPALTTVRQPIASLGRAAFDLAVDAVKGGIKEETVIDFKPELIIRESA